VKRSVRSGLTVAAGLLLSPALAACSAFLGNASAAGTAPSPPSAQRCQQLLTAPSDATQYHGTTVFLMDGSASTVARQRYNYAALLKQYFPRDGDDLLLTGVFGGTVDWLPEMVTPGKSKDRQRTENDLTDARNCYAADLVRAERIRPNLPGTDILRALAKAGEQAAGGNGRIQIVMATDGLTNVGCADLRGADIGDVAAIPGMVKSCRAEIPQLGSNIEVRMLAIGNPGASQPDVKTPAMNWLKDLWTQMCVATDAHCVPPSLAAAQLIPASGAGAYPADPAVPMPAIKMTPGNPATVIVPASILFSTDSDQLGPQAQQTLDQVVSYVRQFKYKAIEVRGYTDARGTPQHNNGLSEQRAGAVVTALQERGIGDLTAKGLGESDPRCTPQYENGAPDLVAMACDRRVEISIYY
jgi:outer membrane protein OmpA-like peptidoglycan-associated protein